MKIYGIYVKCDQNLKKQFGLKEIEIVKGVDTRNGKWKRFASKIDQHACQKLENTIKTNFRDYHHDLTEGAVGCFLSHLTIYEKFLKDSNEQYALVFEEDTIVHPHIAFSLESQSFPLHMDIVFLNHCLMKKIRYNKDYYRLLPDGHFWMTNAYIISRKGARKIIKHSEKNKIKMQFDSYLSSLHQQKYLSLFFTSFCYFPQKKQHETTVQTSQIKNHHCYDLAML